jgi:hypothetical protein
VINWVRRFLDTGSVAPLKMGGHKPKAIIGEHHVFSRSGSGNESLPLTLWKANSTTKLFSCARMTAPTSAPQPFNSSRTTPTTRPSDRNAPIPFEFEPVRTAEDARNALTAVIGAMAAGEITGAEAAEAMRPIQLFLETLVVEMAENRIAEMVKRKRG